jgi:hypothetical protein
MLLDSSQSILMVVDEDDRIVQFRKYELSKSFTHSIIQARHSQECDRRSFIIFMPQGAEEEVSAHHHRGKEHRIPTGKEGYFHHNCTVCLHIINVVVFPHFPTSFGEVGVPRRSSNTKRIIDQLETGRRTK